MHLDVFSWNVGEVEIVLEKCPMYRDQCLLALFTALTDRDPSIPCASTFPSSGYIDLGEIIGGVWWGSAFEWAAGN